MLTLKSTARSANEPVAVQISSRIAGVVRAYLCSLTIMVVAEVGSAEADPYLHGQWQVSTSVYSDDHPGCDSYPACACRSLSFVHCGIRERKR